MTKERLLEGIPHLLTIKLTKKEKIQVKEALRSDE